MEEITAKKENRITSLESIGVLPKLSFIIIIVSLVFHFIYYKNFGLPIKYFMNFSELGVAMSEDLIYVIPIYAGLLIVTLLNSALGNYLRGAGNKLEIPKTKTKFYFNPIFLRISIMVLVLLQIVLMLSKHKGIFLSLDLFASIIYGMATYALLSLKDNYDSGGLLGARNYAFISIFILVLGMQLSKSINSVERGKYIGTTITTSDTTYISTDSTYFIGKTEKYVFIYKVRERGTLIIPSELVKQMFIKSK